MLEIEMKILNQKHETLEPKILQLGGKKTFERVLTTIIFDKNSSLLDSKKSLRLRQEGDKCILCFKKAIQNKNTKMAEEHEIEVSDFQTTRTILNGLGYEERLTFKKQRVSYKLGNVEFDFDLLFDQTVPEFLEIEAESEEELYSVVELLGFSKSDCKNMNGSDVIKYYAHLKK